MGIAQGRGWVRTGTVSSDIGLMDSLCIMRLITPAVREKGLDLLDCGGGVGFIPAYNLAVAGLLASEEAPFLQQAVVQGSGTCSSGEVLAVHDSVVNHHEDGGGGSGDEVGRAGWHSSAGRGRGARGSGVRGAGIWQRREVHILS